MKLLYFMEILFFNIIYEPNKENIKIFDPWETYMVIGYTILQKLASVFENCDLIDSEMYIKKKLLQIIFY